jgi:hypothetical protein
MRSRRLKMLVVRADNLVDLFKNGFDGEFIGVPQDATVIAMERGDIYNDDYNTMFIVVESSEFEEVPEGHLLPRVSIVIQKVTT